MLPTLLCTSQLPLQFHPQKFQFSTPQLTNPLNCHQNDTMSLKGIGLHAQNMLTILRFNSEPDWWNLYDT